MTEMTVTREEEINSGSAITDQEKECLKKAVTKIVIEDKVMADSLEALIGAIYLDKGLNYTEKLILNL